MTTSKEFNLNDNIARQTEALETIAQGITKLASPMVISDELVDKVVLAPTFTHKAVVAESEPQLITAQQAVDNKLAQFTANLAAKWYAAPSKPFKRLTFHTTATRPEWLRGQAKLAVPEIRRWHTEPKPRGNGWSDTGYHGVIGRGELDIVEARPLSRDGAHVFGQNTNNMGLSFMGGYTANAADARATANDDFFDYYTAGQFEMFLACTVAFRLAFEVNMAWSTRNEWLFAFGHNDFTNLKTCPNFKVGKLVSQNHPKLNNLFNLAAPIYRKETE